MSQRLSGKKAVVTAAGQGIGRAIALQFAKEGAQVFAIDINQLALEKLQEEMPEIFIYPLDVTNDNAIEQFATKVPATDILLNAVGYVHHGSILDCSEDDWDFSFDVNIKSMYRMIKIFLPTMLKKNAGNIINIASVASSIKGVANRFVYGTSKAAVIGLTKSIAADFASNNIRCNAICPGTVQTPSLQIRMEALAQNFTDVQKTFVARQPLGRLGTPEEIAALATYLASDEATFTTGTIQIIDGGWSN